MTFTRLFVFSCLILACTLALAQGRSSSKDREIHDKIAKKVKQETKKVVENFQKLAENYRKNAEKYRENVENYSNLHPKIHEIVQDQVKQAVEKHLKDVKEVVESAKLIASARRGLETESRKHQHHDNHRHNNNQNKVCGGSEEENSSSQEERGDNSKADNLAQFQSQVNDLFNRIRYLKSKFGNNWREYKNLAKSQYEAKLDELRKALGKSVLPHSDKTDSRSSKDNDGSDDTGDDVDDVNVIIEDELNGPTENQDAETHRQLRNYLSETLKSEIEEVRSAKQRFLDAKGEMVDAAKKLHSASGSHPFDFQLLIEFKSELHEMLLRKSEYISQKLLFKSQVREAIRKFFNPQPAETTQSVEEVSTKEPQEAATGVSTDNAEDKEPTAEPDELTTGSDERTTENIVSTTKQDGQITELADYVTEEVVRSTEQAEPVTEQTVRSTEQAEPVTEQAVRSTEQAEPATEQAARSTEQAEPVTEQAVRSTEQAEPVTEQAVRSTEEQAVVATEPTGGSSEQNGQSTTESDISDGNNADAVQVPDEYTSTENGEEGNISQSESLLGQGHNGNISDANGLKLAAMGTGSDDVSDGDGTVVVVVVLSCLVICSVVSVLAVLVWKRHRRQRLYTRIPSGDVSRQFR